MTTCNCNYCVQQRKFSEESRRLLEMASHALRSFQFGNTAPDFAKDQADAIDRFLVTGEPQTIEGKKQQ